MVFEDFLGDWLELMRQFRKHFNEDELKNLPL